MQDSAVRRNKNFGFHPYCRVRFAHDEQNGCGGHKMKVQNEWIIRGITTCNWVFPLFYTFNKKQLIIDYEN
jgi:hypothetical protein